MAAVGGDLVRTAEWHRVRDFAQEVRTLPAALAIQGEAGAGKSMLWRAGIETAVVAGHGLLRSEPSASETDLSFARLAELHGAGQLAGSTGWRYAAATSTLRCPG